MALAWIPADLSNDEPEQFSLDPLELAGLPSLEELLQRPTWHADAACRGEGTGRWFPERGEPTEPAKSVCGGCLVRDECSAAGVHEGGGIWGGLSGRQRRAVRRTAA